MSMHLYTVTLTDLGTYKIGGAAADVDEAVRIAKTILLEEATQSAPDLTVIKREVDGTAEIDTAATANAKSFQVDSIYRLDFWVEVVAEDRAQAARYARRLVDDSGGPFEFFIGDSEYGPWIAREVQP